MTEEELIKIMQDRLDEIRSMTPNSPRFETREELEMEFMELQIELEKLKRKRSNETR